MTTLFLALLMIESVDILFALDSIPAIFAITTDPFIIYTSNVFAILGLRSLYFPDGSLVGKVALYQVWARCDLSLYRAKMLVAKFLPISVSASLIIILAILGLTAAASIVNEKRNNLYFFCSFFASSSAAAASSIIHNAWCVRVPIF